MAREQTRLGIRVSFGASLRHQPPTGRGAGNRSRPRSARLGPKGLVTEQTESRPGMTIGASRPTDCHDDEYDTCRHHHKADQYCRIFWGCAPEGQQTDDGYDATNENGTYPKNYFKTCQQFAH